MIGVHEITPFPTHVDIMDWLDVKQKIYVNIMDWVDVKKISKNYFFGIDAQRGNVGVSVLLFFKNKPYVSFYGRLSFPLFHKN